MFFRILRFRWVQFQIFISMVTGPIFTGLALSNAGEIDVETVTHLF